MTIFEMKDLCKTKRITYAKLSQVSGVSEGVIKNIFSGFTQNPRIDTINKLEYGLRVLCNFEVLNTHQVEFTEEEKEVIEMYRLLPKGMKKNVFEMLSSLSGSSLSNKKID